MNIILGAALALLGLSAAFCGLGGKVAEGANRELSNGLLIGGAIAFLIGLVWFSRAIR